MLSIGAFSRISKVTVNALRYYDEIGLLKPVHVNGETGYRYYDTAQLRTVLLISKLKAYHLSLEEIAEVLREPENSGLLHLLEQKRLKIRQDIHLLDFTLQQIDRDILHLERGNSIMSNLDKIEVTLKETQPQTILFVRKEMSTKDYGLYLAQLYQRIEQQKLTVTGAPITIFHHEGEFNPDCYDNEIAIPVKETAEGTRQLPGGLCAMVTLNGPYTELPAVYTKLQQWIEKEKYKPVSAAYEIYLTDPHITPAEENITEVYLPVQK